MRGLNFIKCNDNKYDNLFWIYFDISIDFDWIKQYTSNEKINSTRASKELQYRYKENLLVGLALIIVSVLIGTNTEDKVIPAIVFYSYVWIIGAYLISTVTVCWYLLSIIDLAPKSERTEEEKKPGAPKGKYRIGKDGIS